MSQQDNAPHTPTFRYDLGLRQSQLSTYGSMPFEGLQFGQTEGLTPNRHQFQEGEFAPPGFFDKVDPAMFQLPTQNLQWSYEKRRMAQQILPCLYLGPWGCLSDRGWLNREGITLLLCVRDRRLAMASLMSGQKAAADLHIEADSFDTADNQELITVLPRAIRRINDHLFSSAPLGLANATNKKVVVFCETGNGPSALLVVAYLMVMFDINIPQALQIVQSQRFCLDLDDAATQLLTSFEAILNAKRDVEKANQSVANGLPSSSSTTPSRKREMSDTDGAGDMDMDDMDVAQRRAFAPFKDR
ncbi:dual specificity protein phosphatase 3 [Aspergillus heteromorphus CBS 117.55]|uniref:Dual specificity protein phosphatase 3 n=1 Tax=Aspergillus heteromorphus CBS 117.55 TaxID=1448321 RepID=A0A317VT33_9EURO|nr:dual specificity protein phosphatase 3 [Aspergillus heteromorphus CBS 117.55]PWY77486.1 dual specificity protein phosphatase 3 [Aspergillus heteromorphus CBS 117.55]